LAAHQRGTPAFEARIRGGNGPIFAVQEVNEFTLDIPARVCLLVDDDDNIGTTRVVMRPYVPDLKVVFNMFAGTSTFADGATTFGVSTTDEFEQVEEGGETAGIFKHDVEVPDGEDVYCYTVEVQQETEPDVWSELAVETVNGEVCRVKAYKVGLSSQHYYPRELRLEYVKECSSGVSWDAVIAGGPEEAIAWPKFEDTGTSTYAGLLVADASQGDALAVLVDALGCLIAAYDVVIGDTVFDGKVAVCEPESSIGKVVGGQFVSAEKLPVIRNVGSILDIELMRGASEYSLTAQIICPRDDAAEMVFTARFYKSIGGVRTGGEISADFRQVSANDYSVTYRSAKKVILVTNPDLEGSYDMATVIYVPESEVENTKIGVVVPQS